MQLESEEIKMTCKKCGKEVFSGDLFCENCGEKVSTETTEAKQPSAFENFINKFKSDKKTRNIGLAVLGGLIVIIIAIAIIASAGNTIKLTDYITAEVIGIDGYGTVQFDIDEEKLYEDVFGTAPADTYENLAKLLQYEEKCDNLMDCITILEVEGNGTFANNDTALIEITFENNENKFGKSIKGGTFKYKISGLEKGEVVDPFSEEYVNIVFTGADGFGVGEAEKVFEERWVYGTTYTFSKEEKLSNGDKITVTAEINESYEDYLDELLKDGKVIEKKTTKEITVSGLTVYASASDINESLIKNATNLVLDEYKESNDSGETRENLKIVGVFFKDKKDKSEPYVDSWNGFKMYNSLDVIVSYVDVYGSTRIERTVHIVFENLEKGLTDLKDIEMEDDGFETSVLNAQEAEAEFFDDYSEEFNITKLQ